MAYNHKLIVTQVKKRLDKKRSSVSVILPKA